jgi:two-component system, cell cycle sensor histidine kinase and response regulator CckA
MTSLRNRYILPLTLFGWLPAIGAAHLMGHSLEWFYSFNGFAVLATVTLLGYLLSGWLLRPVASVMNATASVMRGVPPAKAVSHWLPADFWKLRCDINMLFAKHRQALNAAEAHANQTSQRLAHAERLLRESFTALQGIFSVSDEGVAVIDLNGAIIASNARLDLFLETPVDKLAVRNVQHLTATIASCFKDKPKLTQWLNMALQVPGFKGQIESAAADDEQSVYSLRTAPMLAESGEVMGRLIILRDYSEVRVLQKQLRESQKLGTIGQLAGGIAHDFNNMLTTIRGNITLAELASPASSPDMLDRLQNASQATQRAADLVRQLLCYSRHGKGSSHRTLVNLKKLLSSVQALVRPSVDPLITISAHFMNEASFVTVDVMQLEQVLLNLCFNARDAVSPKSSGLIEIGLKNVSHPKPGSKEKSNFVMITVADNGVGVEEDLKHRIFEPFFTTKSDGRGNGLGLSMAQDIVREHGGWIEFDSELGRGTLFRIYLPRSPDPERIQGEDTVHDWHVPGGSRDSSPSVTAAATPSGVLRQNSLSAGQRGHSRPLTPAAPTSRGTILVVDDEAPVRAIAVNMLSFLGYKVLEAGDGQQAIDIILRSGESVDAMLLDIYMPKLSGRDAFKQLRASGYDVPVVICSGFIIDPDEFVIMSEGRCPPVEILLKPYSLEILGKAIAKAVQSQAKNTVASADQNEAETPKVLIA